MISMAMGFLSEPSTRHIALLILAEISPPAVAAERAKLQILLEEILLNPEQSFEDRVLAGHTLVKMRKYSLSNIDTLSALLSQAETSGHRFASQLGDICIRGISDALQSTNTAHEQRAFIHQLREHAKMRGDDFRMLLKVPIVREKSCGVAVLTSS